MKLLPFCFQDAPPPGAYNVAQSFEKSAKPCMAKPRTEAARRKHNSFMSAASRFAQPPDIVTKRPENDNPGPGAYESPYHTGKGGLMVTRDRRFRQDMEEFPGPGTYEVSYSSPPCPCPCPGPCLDEGFVGRDAG
ncbi:sperm-tail PG-rich repeat-containing protein 2-like [Plakobranchus ocellatus]|uniref:Sperm-tail PG-rich repeat-containing protein 2-like n=1 Tax=Plakobranchus ocellatus TaxID=259542 RepID=A0AAV4BWZ8_9GAST|nr:sperm-tail PG-rich repeat-containing protein 2-like [Plakobranchus ocellatus]